MYLKECRSYATADLCKYEQSLLLWIFANTHSLCYCGSLQIPTVSATTDICNYKQTATADLCKYPQSSAVSLDPAPETWFLRLISWFIILPDVTPVYHNMLRMSVFTWFCFLLLLRLNYFVIWLAWMREGLHMTSWHISRVLHMTSWHISRVLITRQ